MSKILDSDRDGASNIAELLAFTNPNDPQDTPQLDFEPDPLEDGEMVKDIKF